MREERATVAIVGGGPAGLTAAVLLAQRGIDVLLLERRPTTSHLPRAHLLNVRTMEIFHEIGAAEDVYALSPPEDRWHRVGWYTSLAGPTPLHGREIGHVHAWGGGPDAPRYAAASPRRFANVPQLRLDPVLRRHAARTCPGRIRYHQEVVDLGVDDDGGAVLTVCDRDGDASYEVRARYAIVADGGRRCAALLGIDESGPSGMLEIVSQHVAMDLSAWIRDDEVLLTYFINPDGDGSFAGSLCAMGPDAWGRDSKEWAVHLAFAPGDPAAHDREGLLARVRRLLGIDDLQIEVRSITHWEFEGVVAERFRAGPYLLAGNAAHRHPPTGGLGLNCAVQDVHNLAWKLDAVLEGYADDTLLDTYASERRPVAEWYVEHSLANVGGHARVAAALGLRRGQPEEEGWKEIAVWAADGDGDETARRRAAVAAAVASNSDDYSQLNVEAGYAYDNGAVLSDGTLPPASHRSLREYTPTTRPGHRLPHAWLERDGEAVSTVDLVARHGLTLFVTGACEGAWREAAAEASAESGCPLHVVAIGGDTAARDASGAWRQLRETSDHGALLVRPDGFVAWRSAHRPPDPSEALQHVVAAVLGGGAPGVLSGDIDHEAVTNP